MYVRTVCEIRLETYGSKHSSQSLSDTPFVRTFIISLKNTVHVWTSFILNDCSTMGKSHHPLHMYVNNTCTPLVQCSKMLQTYTIQTLHTYAKKSMIYNKTINAWFFRLLWHSFVLASGLVNKIAHSAYDMLHYLKRLDRKLVRINPIIHAAPYVNYHLTRGIYRKSLNRSPSWIEACLKLTPGYYRS